MSRKAGFGENSVRLKLERKVRREDGVSRASIHLFQNLPAPFYWGCGNRWRERCSGLVMGKYLLESLGDQRKTASLEIKFLSRSCKIQPAQQQLLGRRATVGLRRLDQGDPGEVRRLVQRGGRGVRVGTCGPPGRFVHSAGILRDALLMNQDGEKYDAVFKPKAWAALYLNHALEKFNCDKLEFLWLFSSVSPLTAIPASLRIVRRTRCWIRCRATATPRACPARRCSGPVRFLRPVHFREAVGPRRLHVRPIAARRAPRGPRRRDAAAMGVERAAALPSIVATPSPSPRRVAAAARETRPNAIAATVATTQAGARSAWPLGSRVWRGSAWRSRPCPSSRTPRASRAWTSACRRACRLLCDAL